MSTSQEPLNHIKSMAITYGIDTPEIDKTMERPFVSVGQHVVFVYNRETACPAIVSAIHEDYAIDCTATIPETGWKVKNALKVGGNFERYRKMSLGPRYYVGVRYEDPLVIWNRHAVPLSQEQQASSTNFQTVTDVWRPAEKKKRLPEMKRLTPGTWFHADPYQWKIWCKREEVKDKHFTYPGEEKSYGPYLDYAQAFEKYFKQYKKLSDKWHRVELMAEKRSL